MAFDFPNSPVTGQKFTPAGGPTYIYNGYAWGLTGTVSAAVLNQQVFTASGTYTPTPGMQTAEVEAVGGGGAGGGAASAANTMYCGGGGGSGGYSKKLLLATTIGTSQIVTIGAGGVGVSNASGGNGGDTSLGALVVAKGGSGGSTGNSGVFPAGGAGGSTTGAVGVITAAGAPGTAGSYNIANASIVTASVGGSSIFGGGAPTTNVISSNIGINASSYGSGGSGGGANGAGAVTAGGNGSSGIVIITEYGAISAAGAGQIILPNYLGGLTLSNDTTTPNTVIDIATGGATSDDNSVQMNLAAAITKNCNAAWAVGSGNGALDSGSTIPAAAWLHVFLIMRTDSGVVDVLVSQSATAPTLPTNYTKKRRIGSIRTVSSVILAFSQLGDKFYWRTPIEDYNAYTLPTAVTALTLSVPSGLQTEAQISVYFSTNTPAYFTIWPLDQTGAGLNSPSGNITMNGWGVGAILTVALSMRTNTTQNINIQASAAALSFNLTTQGWIDNRGK